jgi:hypothetical protein
LVTALLTKHLASGLESENFENWRFVLVVDYVALDGFLMIKTRLYQVINKP